jgi:hypothetical protein
MLDALSMKFDLSTSPGELAFFATTLLGRSYSFTDREI